MNAVLRLAAKDLRLEARARELVTAMLLTALLVVTVGLFALRDVPDTPRVAAAVLWMAVAFGSVLGLARSVTAEHDRRTLEALLLLPVERGSLYLGKVASNLALILLVEVIIVPAYALFAGGAWAAAAPQLIPLFALGTLGISAVGTILAALATATRSREVMLPVLLLPLLFPVLLSTVTATREALEGQAWSAVRGELTLLAGYDLAMLAASWLLFEYAVEG